jgi:hypothetical protein
MYKCWQKIEREERGKYLNTMGFLFSFHLSFISSVRKEKEEKSK